MRSFWSLYCPDVQRHRLNCLRGAINRRADALGCLSICAATALGVVLPPGTLAFAGYRHKKGRVGLPALPGYEALGHRCLLALRSCFPLRSPVA